MTGKYDAGHPPLWVGEREIFKTGWLMISQKEKECKCMDKQTAIINMILRIENDALLDKVYDFVKRLYRRGSKK